MERMEPAEPIEGMEPAEAMERTEFLDRIDHRDVSSDPAEVRPSRQAAAVFIAAS
jgi:hypothetical protein